MSQVRLFSSASHPNFAEFSVILVAVKLVGVTQVGMAVVLKSTLADHALISLVEQILRTRIEYVVSGSNSVISFVLPVTSLVLQLSEPLRKPTSYLSASPSHVTVADL